MALKNVIFKFLISLCILFFSSSILIAQNDMPNAVVKILSYHQTYNLKMPWLTSESKGSSGSAFVIEGNIILSNAHVVSNAKYLEVKKQDNPKKYTAYVKYISHISDLAILEVNTPSFYDDITPLKLGGIPNLNSIVKTIGFPMGGEKISITTGIISRIEKIIYSHSGADEHLAIQTDAAINPGNSGGPVIQGNKVVGVAFQGIRSGDNIGYMIPTTLVKHLLTDIKDGKLDLIPEVGVYYNPLPPVMKKYLNMKDDESGVITIAVHYLSPLYDILERNDVLTEINGYKIQDDGNISLNDFKVQFYEVIERSQYGEEIDLTWYRNGEKMNKKITLTPFKLPVNVGSEYNTEPEYLIFAGLTFVKLSGDYMRSLGNKWWQKIPHHFRLLYYYQTLINKDTTRKSYIFLSEVLEDPENSHAKGYKNQIIETVNGKKILSFKDLENSFNSISSGFHVMDFMENPSPLILEYNTAKKIHKDLLKKNYITKPSRFKNGESD